MLLSDTPFLILIFILMLLGIILRLSRSGPHRLPVTFDRSDESLLIGLLLFGLLVVSTFLATAFL